MAPPTACPGAGGEPGEAGASGACAGCVVGSLGAVSVQKKRKISWLPNQIWSRYWLEEHQAGRLLLGTDSTDLGVR